MKVIILFLLSFSMLTACSSTPSKVTEKASSVERQSSASLEWDEIIAQAENTATPPARKVLLTLRNMIERGEIIKGGCWDYLDTGFTRAGVSRNQRKTVFSANKLTGPYADIMQIQAGDWLYYINHGYGGTEHSGVFIGWVDKTAQEALILSYAGEQRQEPGRYSVYDLSHVYQIIRPK